MNDVGLSNKDLVDEAHFPAVASSLNRWFLSHLDSAPTGVLVSHNTATDIQFLFCEYMRHNIQLPKQLNLGLDTLTTLKRFSSLCYRKVAPEDWPQLTDKGKLSMGVKPCAIHALSHRDPPEEFVDACGERHDAEADTRAVAVILFDEKQFKNQGLFHCVFKTHRKCFQPLDTIWSAMEEKLKEPVLKLESVPAGWVPSEVSKFNNCRVNIK